MLVIAEDDDTYRPKMKHKAITGSLPEWKVKCKPEKILFCGWRRDLDDLISVMDDFVSKGSELWLYNEVPIQKRRELLLEVIFLT